MKKSRPRLVSNLRQLRLNDGDILVVKKSLAGDNRLSFVRTLEETLDRDVIIFFVDRLSDIKLIGEDELRSVGLMRIPDEDN